MFKLSILEEMLKFAGDQVKSTFKKIGPFKVKPSDVPDEVKDNEGNIEFRSGIAKISSKEWYWGEWLAGTDIKHGRGIYWYRDKNIYEGFWINGKINGKGRMISKNYVYQGNWINGNATGKGVLVDTKAKIKYKGTFLNFRPHGKWVQVMENGAILKGQFKQGIKDGKWVWKFHDGGSYEGQYKEDMKDGRGILKNPNGDQYDGEFK